MSRFGREIIRADKKEGRLVKTDLAKVLGVIEPDNEKHLGLICIGEALR
jgi:hypothetical protein